MERTKTLLLQHINFILSQTEARQKLAFGDYLIVYFSSLPSRLLTEATKEVAYLLPDYQLNAFGDRLYMSLKRGWRDRLKNLFTVSDKWFVRLEYSRSLSCGLPQISSVEFDKAAVL